MVANLEGGLGKPVPTTNYRACYEYERREGCSRVTGDEEEDGVDDLEGSSACRMAARGTMTTRSTSPSPCSGRR